MKCIIRVLILSLLLTACGGQEPVSIAAETTSAVEGRGEGKENWWDTLPRSEWSQYRRMVDDVEWFEVYEVNDGVYAIYEPGQFEEVISFLVLGEAKALLFDTGLGIAPLRPVIERLTNLPLMVLNSHSHYDHVGGNHEFSDIRSIDTAYTNERTGGLSNANVGEYVRGDWLWKETPDGFDADSYAVKPWQISQSIKDADVIDLGGRKLEVLWTPGHSPDSICLLDRENRLLFTGDVFYLAPLYAHLEGSDFNKYKTSVARLAALQPEIDYLMTAHNVPVADSTYLSQLENAFTTIARGEGSYVETDGAHEYTFNGFSVIVPTRIDSN